MHDLLKIVNTVLSNRNKKNVEDINASMNLKNDLGFDSLDLAELTVRIEAKFDVDIFEKGIVTTIGEILALLPNE